MMKVVHLSGSVPNIVFGLRTTERTPTNYSTVIFVLPSHSPPHVPFVFNFRRLGKCYFAAIIHSLNTIMAAQPRIFSHGLTYTASGSASVFSSRILPICTAKYSTFTRHKSLTTLRDAVELTGRIQVRRKA